MKLKECPFCGGAAKISENALIFSDGTGYIVRCLRCNSSNAWYHDEEEAVHVWNERIEKKCENCKHKDGCNNFNDLRYVGGIYCDEHEFKRGA